MGGNIPFVAGIRSKRQQGSVFTYIFLGDSSSGDGKGETKSSR